jgi:hypothetical protein
MILAGFSFLAVMAEWCRCARDELDGGRFQEDDAESAGTSFYREE